MLRGCGIKLREAKEGGLRRSVINSQKGWGGFHLHAPDAEPMTLAFDLILHLVVAEQAGR